MKKYYITAIAGLLCILALASVPVLASGDTCTLTVLSIPEWSRDQH